MARCLRIVHSITKSSSHCTCHPRQCSSCSVLLLPGDKLQLQGLCAFDAAVHCASLTSWPTAAGNNAGSKQQGKASHWIKTLLLRLFSRIDLVAGPGLQSA